MNSIKYTILDAPFRRLNGEIFDRSMRLRRGRPIVDDVSDEIEHRWNVADECEWWCRPWT